MNADDAMRRAFPPPKPAPAKPVENSVRGSLWVSSRGEEVVLDLEAAVMRLAAAKGREEVENAYSALCQRRRDLFEYLSELEEGLSIPRPILKRF